MGGDAPLDAKDEIYSICGIKEFPENGTQAMISPQDFEKNMPAILEFLRSQENDEYYDNRTIGFQVLGVLMMRSGTPITEELKSEILMESEKDTWSTEDEERNQTVRGFEEALRSYTGEPIIIRSRGLFEVIGERLSKQQ